MKRPSHTAWFDRACCAIAIGWRVWIGMTAVPSSCALGRPPISVIAVSPSKSFGICGTQIDVKPSCSAASARRSALDLLAVPPLSGRSSGRSASAPPRMGSSCAYRPASRWQWHSRFPRAALHQRSRPYHRDTQTGGGRGRVAVVTGAASGMGRRSLGSPAAWIASACSISKGRRPRPMSPRAAAAGGRVAAGRRECHRGVDGAMAAVRGESDRRDPRHRRGHRPFQSFTEICSSRGSACSR